MDTMSKPRVLVVEDDNEIADVLRRSLRIEGYDVHVAGDGREALDDASVFEPDAVVLDLGLPGLDGVEVSRRLRAGGDVPILMLTARDSLEDRVGGLDSGADDYLVKPFEREELLARLRALLRRGPALTPQEIVVGDLVVDTRAHRVWRAGEELALTPKEYALLEYLARNAGRVVSRADITAHVWDDNHDPLTNAIEVYINRLRRKVDREGLTPLLVTRRGAGYALAAAAASARREPNPSGR